LFGFAGGRERGEEEEDYAAESLERRARERGDEEKDDATQSAEHRARGGGGRHSTERREQS
jgi:hypothetical protein